MDEQTFRKEYCRRAVGMEIGGFRPPEELDASFFGKVNLCLPNEKWPETDGQPMHALCQVNLTDLPFKPSGLEDVAFLTVFIGPDKLPIHTPNGEGWCLRSYKSLEDLVPLTQVNSQSSIKTLPMRPTVIEEDYPGWDDAPIELTDEVGDSYHDLFSTHGGFKLGGWPSLIQSEIFWAPNNQHPDEPMYVFQIDSTEKGNWAWEDGGVGYFGRGQAEGATDNWSLQWQCY